jgi:uncharacterized membrane protein
MNPLEHLHPAVVHFPITLLIVASATGLLYFYWRQIPELRFITWASMGMGWIACLVAVLTGLIAQSGLPPRPPYAMVINLHIGGGIAILVTYAIVLYRGWIWRQRLRKRIPAAPADFLDVPEARLFTAILLILGAAMVVFTGWNGGQLVYVWGVGVGR